MLKQCSVFILLTKFLQKVKEKKKLEIKKNDFWRFSDIKESEKEKKN
jgi:hypothetical protein